MRTRALLLLLSLASLAHASVAQAAPQAATAQGAFTARSLPAAELAPTPYDAGSGNILFRLTVAGREVWGILDSGAESSMVDLTLAREAGLKVSATPQTLQATGGAVPVWQTDNVAVIVPGQITLNHTLLPAVDLSALSQAHKRNVGFIAGQDWLKAMAVIVDPVAQVFELGPSGQTPEVPGGQVLGLHGASQPLVDVAISGRTTRVTIDTGFNGALTLTPKAWADIVPADAVLTLLTSVGIDGNLRKERTTVLPAVTLGDLRITDVEVLESARWEDWGEGSVGLAYLSNTRFILDLGQRTLTIAPIPVAPELKSAPAP
jgi:hypothetical protein